MEKFSTVFLACTGCSCSCLLACRFSADSAHERKESLQRPRLVGSMAQQVAVCWLLGYVYRVWTWNGGSLWGWARGNRMVLLQSHQRRTDSSWRIFVFLELRLLPFKVILFIGYSFVWAGLWECNVLISVLPSKGFMNFWTLLWCFSAKAKYPTFRCRSSIPPGIFRLGTSVLKNVCVLGLPPRDGDCYGMAVVGNTTGLWFVLEARTLSHPGFRLRRFNLEAFSLTLLCTL